MIWYRHWLELRRTALSLLAVALTLGPLFFAANPEEWTEDPQRLIPPLRQLATLPAGEIGIANVHLGFTWMAVLFLAYLVTGDGLKAMERPASIPSPLPVAQFTLSLPVSRRRVVVTRMAAGYATVAIVLAASALANAMYLSTTGRPVPIASMLAASGFASLLVLFWTTAVTIMMTIAGPWWGGVLALVGMVLSSPLGLWGLSAAAVGQLEWAVYLLFAVVLAFVIYLAVDIAESEEV